MPRLVSVPSAPDGFPDAVTLEVGDLVVFTASGGGIESGSALQTLGTFIGALPGPGGRTLAGQGAPNLTVFRAVAPGASLVRLISGDVRRGPTSESHVRVTVQ
jgi:hypothetical protein